MSAEAIPPIDATGLLREVDEQLIPLLRSLAPEDWQRPAVGGWTVRDVAAHLLDGSLRRLSLDRDAHRPPAPPRDLSDYRELVDYLNELNAGWVDASRRLSPAVLVDLLAHVCPQVADYFDGLDPEGPAAFAVSWAGESASLVWMDVAREYTEKWHHQQQIREAVGAPGIDQERYIRPLLGTFIHAVPRAYADSDAPSGTRVDIHISDLAGASWTLVRSQDGWRLCPRTGEGGVDTDADTTIEIPGDTAWRLFTKGLTGEAARTRAQVTGDPLWALPFFSALAIMA